jgi:hypothetical protein
MVYACEALWKNISKKVKKKYSKGSKQKAFALLCIQEGKQHKEYYIMKLLFSLVFLLPVRYDSRNNVHHTYKHTAVPLLYMLLYSDSSLFLIHHPHFSCRKKLSLGNDFSHFVSLVLFRTYSIMWYAVCIKNIYFPLLHMDTIILNLRVLFKV